jgi:hypothetical protein
MIRLRRKLFIAIIHLLAHCFRLEIAWLCLKDGKVKSGDLWVEYEGKRPVRMSFERLEQPLRVEMPERFAPLPQLLRSFPCTIPDVVGTQAQPSASASI